MAQDPSSNMRNRSSLARALELLAAFRPGEGAVPLTELARRADLPKSTAHRLATTLLNWGAIERTSSGLILGLRLFELGQMAPRQRALRDAALPLMGELYEASHETVHLAARDGTDVVYLEKLHARRRSPAPSRVGGRSPLHSSALGKSILANCDPKTIADLLSQPLARFTSRTLVDPQALFADLEQIRRRGVASDLEETAPGLFCLAAPLRTQQGEILGALSLAAPSRKSARVGRLEVTLKRAAAEIGSTFCSRD